MQADEIRRFGYDPAHGLVVDAYMAQHPGDGTDRRDRQSVFVHLIGLCVRLEQHTSYHLVPDLFQRVLQQRSDFPVLSRSHGPGLLTVVHMVGASDSPEYERRAREWGNAVWESWSGEHERIRRALHATTQTP